MIRRKNCLSLIAMVVISAMLITACSFNKERVGSAFEHLGQNLDDAMGEDTTATTEEEEEVAEVSETSETIAEDITEADPTEPTETPSPTATPTPTEIPNPERVDFSELTEDALTDAITVETEEFAESYVLDDETVISTFEGNRILILATDAVNIQVAVNLILDGYYEEALGMYNRYTNEALAEYDLTPEEDASEFTPMATVVNYDYGFNGRVLSVEMTYEVTRGDEVVTTSYECVSFDLYTGSYIMLENVIKDMDGFLEAANAQLMFTAGIESEEIVEFSNISIMARNDDSSMYIVGTSPDGTRVRALVDTSEYSAFMSRNGRILFL